MKKSLTIFIALFIISSGIVLAQEDGVSDKMNSLKARPLSLILGFGKISYERKMNNHGSFQIGLSYFDYNFEDFGFSGIGLAPEYRFYLTGDAIDGFYLAPFLGYDAITAEGSGNKVIVHRYGGGAKAGFQWLMGKRENFVIDLAFGGRYVDFGYKVETGSGDDLKNNKFLTGFRPDITFALGFAF